MKSIITVFLFVGLLQSCKTYNYTYSSKSESFNDNLITYHHPKIESNYSIVPYVSVLGVGLGGGYLLGNHVHNNMTSVGSPKDTADMSRNLIYLAGAFVAGYGFYALYTDSSAKKTNYVSYNVNELNDWFAHVVDTDDYSLVGTDRNYIYALKNQSVDELTTGDINSLELLYKKISKPQFYSLRDSIMIKSYKKIDNSQHYSFYKSTDKKYDIYLTDCLEGISSFDGIIEYANDVKYSDNEKKEHILKNSANKSFTKIKETNNLNDIQKWKDVFKDLGYSSINRLMPSINEKETELIEKKLREERRLFEQREREKEIAEFRRLEGIRLEKERKRKRELQERQEEHAKLQLKVQYKNEAYEFYNNIINERKEFINTIRLGDCVSILKIKLISTENSFEYLEYILNTLTIGLQKSLFGDMNKLFGINSKVTDGKYLIPINENYGLGMDVFTCKCIVKKIDRKSNQILIEVINGSDKCYPDKKYFMNANELIPCGG